MRACVRVCVCVCVCVCENNPRSQALEDKCIYKEETPRIPKPKPNDRIYSARQCFRIRLFQLTAHGGRNKILSARVVC